MIEEHTDSKTQDNTSTETITQDHSDGKITARPLFLICKMIIKNHNN